MMGHGPRPLALAEIRTLAIRWREHPDCIVLRAGAPSAVPAPGGMSDIVKRGGGNDLGSTGGLTLIKSAAAFTLPQFVTTNSPQRTGTRVEHFAAVQRATATDVVHESFYPAPGDHIRAGMTHHEGGRVFQHYWRVSKEVSELIRRGEQEHLDDARRAFQLTYQRISDAINSLAGWTYGPAPTPYDAERIAEAALATALPRELGTNPATWVQVLDRLLRETKARDAKGWHSITIGPPVTEGDKVLHPVMTTPATKVGSVPSSEIVNY